jgi:ribosomal protein L29
MALSKFTDIVLLSNNEISEAIIEIENQVFHLRFKQATRKNVKAHELQNTKRRLAQLKTLLTSRLQNLEKEDNNLISNS